MKIDHIAIFLYVSVVVSTQRGWITPPHVKSGSDVHTDDHIHTHPRDYEKIYDSHNEALGKRRAGSTV